VWASDSDERKKKMKKRRNQIEGGITKRKTKDWMNKGRN
jgi:hypothetical protein